ncbi:MAG TPA: hemolysin family protein [Thermoanaerobaculia bacterium]|nr:hemolysin family protein [Thermoanaerobaculia bacterium]
MGIGTEVLLLVLLALFNGVLAMSEIALVSARKVRLRKRAEAGDRGAQAALELAASPGRFLSTVQIGITLVGILAGAFGGATLAEELAGLFAQVPLLAPYREAIAFAVVVAGITYLSLVIGELVPKQFALNAPEKIASVLARPLKLLSKVTAPAVFVLDGSTRFILRLLGTRPSEEPPITEEELRHLLKLGTRAGVFEEGEQEIVARVLRLGERLIGELVTPRRSMVALDVDDPPEVNWSKIAASNHFYFPVYEGSPDRVLGLVSVKDLWARAVAGERPDLRSLVQEPVYLPESVSALRGLERLRETGSHLALVLDEYGGIEGLVTLHDILRAIVGELPTLHENEPMAVRREDGSWLLDGRLSLSDLPELLGISSTEGADLEEFQTLGGFVMGRIGRVPETGNDFKWGGFRFEVVDMDDRRVDKVLVEAEAAASLDEPGSVTARSGAGIGRSNGS